MNLPKEDTWLAPQSNAAQLVSVLFRSRNHIWNNDQHIVVRHGLTWTQFYTLLSLRMRYPSFSMLPTEIYSAAQVTSGGLTKMLQALELEGLITRVDNPEDGRSRYVKLTRTGVKTVETVVEQLVEVNTTLFSYVLSEKERTQLVKLLQKLSAGLDELQ